MLTMTAGTAHAAFTADVVVSSGPVPVTAEPTGEAVSLDTSLYLPPATAPESAAASAQGSTTGSTPDSTAGSGAAAPAPRPAVLLAHGFGGSKADLDEQARRLANRGYVVLTYSARGFGQSGGRIHLNDPAFEIADARRLIDRLAARSDVRRDGVGDPRVGVAGSSYGGALALMLAGADRRVDAVVAAATWNDLGAALYPSGVPKARWASVFFSAGASSASVGNPNGAGPGAGTATAATSTSPSTSGGPARSTSTSTSSTVLCGRFDPEICARFTQASVSGFAPVAMRALLTSHSPAPSLPRVAAPTLLLQGMGDSLFGIDQAIATDQALAATGTPVASRWFEGGHDGGVAAAMPSEDDTLLPWFDAYLARATAGASASSPAAATTTPPMPLPRLTVTAPSLRRNGPLRTLTAEGISWAGGAELRLPFAPTAPAATAAKTGTTGTTGVLLSPPGAAPAATVLLPGGLGALTTTGGAAYRLAALPGQSVAFDTEPVADPTTVVGAPRVRLRVVSSARDATLFVSLWRVGAGVATLPRALLTPVRVATTPGRPVEVDVDLPAGTYALDEGSRWRVLVSATEASFAAPRDARLYDVSLASSALTFPTLPGAQQGGGSDVDAESVGVAIALGVTLLLIALVAVGAALRRRRRDSSGTRDDLAETPLAVQHLVKTYRDGHRAVDDVSWLAERGQVVGLLGPNGAGKTTTIRMILGLIRPDSGTAYVHGVPVHAGSAALGRVGALVEGPGFLPHLTGRANLAAYWEATGRPTDEAHLAEALSVAALGDALDRPVRSYSHGMRQRLGIAQAMLGMPEVLLLDEPANGLDPPQIAAMRPILTAYAATGRTVVVSSHLLAEVEATCTHVVVMHRGKVLLAGPLTGLVEDPDTTVITLEDEDPTGPTSGPSGPTSVPTGATGGAQARRTHSDRVVAALPPDWSIDIDGPRLVVRAPGVARADVVATVVAAGGNVAAVGGRRRLEEVFLGAIAHASAPKVATIDNEALRQVRSR